MGEYSDETDLAVKLNDHTDLLNRAKGIDRHATDEEFQNFVHRVNEVSM